MFTGITIAAAFAAAPASAPEPPDPVPVFVAWADEQGALVEQPACDVYVYADGEDRGSVICYGLTGDDGAGGHGDVVVALGVPEGDGFGFVPLFGAFVDSPGEASSTFAGGTQIVGQDIEPGRYRASAGDFCYWERLSGFSGDFDDLIANGTAEAGDQVVVEIDASDAGFSSQGCGTWERVE